MKRKSCWVLFWLLICASPAFPATRPGLLLTPGGVKEIRKWSSRLPAFEKSLEELKKTADQALTNPILVPVPKDGGGGYTHEKHKSNYTEMVAAGVLYQITGRRDYSSFVRDMLMEYARIYPELGPHPIVRSPVPGKLFWQTLNESVWLVNTACAYDCVFNAIPEPDRRYIEDNLFYPMAGFISNGNPDNYAVFNRMHNHGTWANAAVGMIGYVMRDQNLVDMALYGSKKDGSAGFFKQLEVLFSPDGYFTEGPYYQRYALWPFLVFAQAIQHQQPELDVFGFRNGILYRAVDAMTQLSYNGELFYLNDALQKTLKSTDIISSVDIAFRNNPEKKEWLEVARYQDAFLVSDAGIFTAKAMYREMSAPVVMKPAFLSDGPAGDQGGIAILRWGSGNDHTCLTFKATSHGLSHGHYDKLSISFFDSGNPVLTDYGSARFLNIEPKSGGNYTPENYSWAMQSIAHNTVSVNEGCQFNGQIKVSSLHHSEINFFDFSDPAVQVVSGTENNAFPGVSMQRTLALLKLSDLENPVVLDIFRIVSDTLCQLDLPFYFRGHPVSSSVNLQKSFEALKPLGKGNGYQHLWLEAEGRSAANTAVFSWVNGSRFYHITTCTNPETQLLMARTGANDPGFNLRSEQGLIIRQPQARRHTFVSVVEPRGMYDLTREMTSGFQSNISGLQLLKEEDEFSVIRVTLPENRSFLFIAVNRDFGEETERSVKVDNKVIRFKGNYQLIQELK